LKHCTKNGSCTVCLEPIEDGERVLRGAHYKCYFRIYRKIRSGLISEKNAIQDGIFREHEITGRKPIEVAELPESIK